MMMMIDDDDERKLFSKSCQERGGEGWVRARRCRNMKAQKKHSKLEFKVFLKV
jgi:hypothetical protein